MKLKIRGLVFVGFAAAVFAQSALAVSDSDKTVTSKTYVDSKIEGTVDNATTITAGSPDDKAPSSLNVYKFVENQIVSSGGGIDGDVTKHTQKIAVFQSGHTPIGTPEDPDDDDLPYITGWKLIVPDSVVAESGTDIGTNIGTINQSGPASGHGSDLTTAQAVYEFVTGEGTNDPDAGFQRKISETEGSILYQNSNINGVTNNGAVEIGYRPYNSATEEYGDSTWGVLKPEADSNDGSAQGYIVFKKDTSKLSWDVNINSAKIAGVYTDIVTAGGGSASNAEKGKLTTAKAVYDYAVKQQWAVGDEGKHLVIGSDGKVTLSTNASPDIPGADDMPTACKTEQGGKVCALVAYWDPGTTVSNPSLQPGQTGYVAAGLRYEWTIMAPTGA